MGLQEQAVSLKFVILGFVHVNCEVYGLLQGVQDIWYIFQSYPSSAITCKSLYTSGI